MCEEVVGAKDEVGLRRVIANEKDPAVLGSRIDPQVGTYFPAAKVFPNMDIADNEEVTVFNGVHIHNTEIVNAAVDPERLVWAIKSFHHSNILQRSQLFLKNLCM